VAEWRESHGLNRPWPVRYAMWLRSCARGDFGTSVAYGMPVSKLIAPRIGRSAAVIFPSWIAAWILGAGLAFVGARRKSRSLESAMTVANMIPEVIVVSLLLWLAVTCGAALSGAWLPMLALTCVVAPLVFLHAYSALAAASDANFVRLAISRGIAPARLWKRFIFPAAANPLLSLLGPSLAAAVGSSLIIEAMTGWPGLGPWFLEAVQARDYEAVQAVVVVLAFFLTLTNFAADLILYRTDPRIRLPHDGAN